MKKKTLVLATLLLTMSLFFSGCLQFVVDLTIKADKSGEFTLKAGMSTKLMEDMGATDLSAFTGDIAAQAEDNDWTMEDYKDDKYTGVVVKGKIKDCTDEAEMKNSLGALMKIEELTVDGKKGMKVSIASEDVTAMIASEAQASDLEELKQFGDVDLTIKVTLPYPVTEHNGTSISSDKKTVTWDLMKTSEANLNASCTESASKGGIPILPVIIVIVVIVVISRFFKKK